MPVRLFHGHWTEATVRARPDELFVFGDNLARSGTGGQAAIRGCANAVGLANKHRPKRDDDAYFSDSDGRAFTAEIRRFHEIVAPRLRDGGVVWWPADGIGTGLAEMPARAPALYQKLCHYARGLFREMGDEQYVSAIVCGGRDYDDRAAAYAGLDAELGEWVADATRLEIIEGGARGADRLGGDWAKARGTIHTCLPADWNKYGKRAGFLRNDDMANRLQARRDQANAEALVIGMPGGRGTEMMLKISRERDFDVRRIGAAPAPRDDDTQTSMSF